MIYDIQRASMGKRISAWLFDFILLATLAVAFALIISAISGYSATIDSLEAKLDKYEEEFGITFDISTEEFNKLTEIEKAEYLEKSEAASEAINKDPEMTAVWTRLINLTIVMTTVSILLSFVALELVVPLLFKNGQTLGKKIFGVGVMRSDGVKVTGIGMFIRTVLGKYTVETMVPIYVVGMIFIGSIGIVGTLVLLGLLILQTFVTFGTRYHTSIHDLLAGTVTVDLASQLIFESTDELNEYKKRIAMEKAQQADY